MARRQEKPAPRRWTLVGDDGRPEHFEEVEPERWDRLDDHRRDILRLPEGGIAFVRKTG